MKYVTWLVFLSLTFGCNSLEQDISSSDKSIEGEYLYKQYRRVKKLVDDNDKSKRIGKFLKKIHDAESSDEILRFTDSISPLLRNKSHYYLETKLALKTPPHILKSYIFSTIMNYYLMDYHFNRDVIFLKTIIADTVEFNQLVEAHCIPITELTTYDSYLIIEQNGKSDSILNPWKKGEFSFNLKAVKKGKNKVKVMYFTTLVNFDKITLTDTIEFFVK